MKKGDKILEEIHVLREREEYAESIAAKNLELCEPGTNSWLITDGVREKHSYAIEVLDNAEAALREVLDGKR